MKNLKFLFLVLAALFLTAPAFSQARTASKTVVKYKSQHKLASDLLKEIRRNHGPKEIANFKRIKTKSAFIKYLQAKKECKNCPLIAELSKSLAVKSEKYPNMHKLTYGQYVTSQVAAYDSDEDGTDPEPDTDDDEDDDRDGDPVEPDCGPFHCLSNWGLHIPCGDMPSY